MAGGRLGPSTMSFPDQHRLLIDAESMADDIVGDIISTEGLRNGSFEFQWTTADVTGTWSIEGSNFYDPLTNPDVAFIPLDFTGDELDAVASADGRMGVPVDSMPYRHLRPRFTATGDAGTGVASVMFDAKGK